MIKVDPKVQRIIDWRESFITLPDNHFFELIRMYLGEIHSPFNKQKLIEQLGAFLRKEETSNDFAPLVDVLLEVLNEYNKRGEYFDNVCCILPTAPLITVDNIVKAYNIISTSDFDSVCPVVSFSYPILRSLCIDDSGKLKMNWPEYRYSRSQDLPLSYHDTGTFYWIKSKVLMEDKKIFAENGTAIVLDELQVQDIDTETDWALAEMKYRLMHKL